MMSDSGISPASVQSVRKDLSRKSYPANATLMGGAQRAASVLTTHGCELLAVSDAKLRQKLDDADSFFRYWVDYLSKRVIDLSPQ